MVVGAGAWGLPAAAELAARGHEVVLLDRHEVGNALASSPGPTRLWRLAHPDALRVRLGLRSVEAMERLGRRSGREVFLRRGLLWRDGLRLEQVVAALAGEGAGYEELEADDKGIIVARSARQPSNPTAAAQNFVTWIMYARSAGFA